MDRWREVRAKVKKKKKNPKKQGGVEEKRKKPQKGPCKKNEAQMLPVSVAVCVARPMME